ncbi:MAG: hypothetical protein GTN90_04945, partial [Xanthomonadales bacterium]|nr:hypothetical protein [Xanthomonadales bacterium]
MAEFEDLNDRFAQDSQAIQVSSTDESSAAAANAAAAMDAARSLGGSGASASGIAIGSSGIDAIAAEEVAEPPI